MARELVIYCDESDKNGRFFSNFYGGALVESVHIEEVNSTLNSLKADLNLFGEVKFSKITENYRQKYIDLMDGFFDLIEDEKVKVRIMFSQNYHVPVGLDAEQIENSYFLLYYQFIKHAFGLRYAGTENDPVRLRLYFDEFPDTGEIVAQFKSFIRGLEQNRQFQRAGISIPEDQITEVHSHEHVVMQCLDVVLGCMQFRLNNKHKDKPEGARRRGKRTIAKEKVYKHVLGRIRLMHQNFNIGISTGKPNGPVSVWEQPYRHWRFIPKNHRIDETSVKP